MENDLQCRLSRCKSIAAVLFENAFSDLKVLLNEIGVKEQVRPNNVDYSTWRMANQIKVYNQCFDYFSENEGLVNSIKKRYNLTGIWCLSTTHGCRMFLTKDNMIAKQTYDLENGKFAESKKEPMGIAVFSSNMTVRRRKSHSSVSFDITMRPEGNKASVVGRTIVGQAIGGTVGGYLGALSAVEQNQRAEQLKNDYVPTLKEVQFDEYGLAFEDQFTDSKMWVYFYAVEIGKKLYVENFIIIVDSIGDRI